jgi:hypothetical protein
MNARRKLHYHSDCDFFAGCENMLANFFNDPAVAAAYDVSFSCRWSERYEAGLRSRVKTLPSLERYPLLPAPSSRATRRTCRSRSGWRCGC